MTEFSSRLVIDFIAQFRIQFRCETLEENTI